MSQRDGYGFQPAEFNKDVAKQALQRIIELHKKEHAPAPAAPTREEQVAALLAGRAEYEREQQAMLDEARIREAEAAVEPVAEVVVPEPDPEPIIDYTDRSLWVEQRTPELTDYYESDGEDRATIVRQIATGRYLITYRQRTPADGDLEYEYLPAVLRPQPEPKKIQWDSFPNLRRSAVDGPRRPVSEATRARQRESGGTFAGGGRMTRNYGI